MKSIMLRYRHLKPKDQTLDRMLRSVEDRTDQLRRHRRILDFVIGFDVNEIAGLGVQMIRQRSRFAVVLQLLSIRSVGNINHF